MITNDTLGVIKVTLGAKYSPQGMRVLQCFHSVLLFALQNCKVKRDFNDSV